MQLLFVVLPTTPSREQFERFARGGHIDGAMLVSLHGADPLPGGCQPRRPGRARRPALHARDDRRRRTSTPTTSVALGWRPGLIDKARQHLGTSPGRATWSPPTTGSTASAPSWPPRPAPAGRRGRRLLGRRRRAGDARSCSTEHRSSTASFVANDLMAVGAMQAIAARGPAVPDDIARGRVRRRPGGRRAAPAHDRAPAPGPDGRGDGHAAARRWSGTARRGRRSSCRRSWWSGSGLTRRAVTRIES